MEPGGTTVADLVEGAAASSPDAVAVVAGGVSLRYRDLDARANRLARHLQSLGVGPEVTVGVCLERSVDLAVALLAVLKAGGACVPLDRAYPGERLAWMAADASVAALVTRASLAAHVPVGAAPVVLVDADAAAAWAGRPPSPPPRSTLPEHLAYVIYTSGSTGRPKGVMLTHRGLVNHHRAVVDLYGLAPGDRVLQFCSIGFDASIEEMFPTWTAGATVVYRPEDVPLLGGAWRGWLVDQRITVVNLPTAYWHAWVADLVASGRGVPADIRLVVVGGERALGPVYRTWARLGGGQPRWVNAYGPTETTCMSTWWEPPAGGDVVADVVGDEDPPIGRPLPNTTVLVVDEGLRPVPAGATGELLIGGAGLARGYLGDPDLTTRRFVDVGTVRMYRTGDLVRELPGGDLAFVGRGDGQVKVQGFRVECGEVEAALARHPAVAAAAVVVGDDPSGATQLVASIVGAAGEVPSGPALRRFLADRLPAHMVPAAFTIVDALPLTPGGKLDRAGLASRAPVAGGTDGPERHGSAAERRMAVIWAQVLGLDAAALGPDADFFDLGGHSLLATQVVARVREEFGTATPLRSIFEAPTLGGLAALVDAERAGPAPAPPMVAGTRRLGETVPLSLAQEQMWALAAKANPPGLYNFTAMAWLDEPVDAAALSCAIADVVERQGILRTAIVADDGGSPRQLVVPTAAAMADLEVHATDLRAHPAAGRDAELARRIGEQEARPFAPAGAPLFRVGLFRVDDARTRLAVTVDHMIADGTGAAILMSELRAAYQARAGGGQPVAPAPLAVQFADFACWQRSHLTAEVLDRQLDWWTSALDGMPRGPAVPLDRVPATATRRIESETVVVGPGTRSGLDRLARATGSTVFAVAVAGVGALLGGHGGTTDVMLSTTLSGRNRAELDGLVGTFSGISRLRADLSGDPAFATLVGRVGDWALGMFEHQDVPFLRVRRAVWPDFPTGGIDVAAALPVDFQYFYTDDAPEVELAFRGQLHPLAITVLDDGAELVVTLSYKLDFYEPATVRRLADDLGPLLAAVAADPSQRLSELPVNRLDGR